MPKPLFRRTLRVGYGVIVAVLAAGLSSSTASAVHSATPSGRELFPKIAFWDTVGRGSGRNQIFVVSPDGRHRVQLTRRGDSEDPQWGPYGHRIVYTHRTAGGDSRIWVMDARGHHKRRLSGLRHRGDSSPTFAPHGGRVLFVRFDGRGRQDLVVRTLRAHKTTRLGVGKGFRLIPSAPDWSPDGRTIVFAGANKATGSDLPLIELFTVHPDGKGLMQITHTPRWMEDSPSWSPKGSRLAYTRAGVEPQDEDCVELVTADRDGSHRARVPVGCEALWPDWSPNGHRLLANLERVHHPGLWSMATNGSHQRFIVSGAGGDWRPIRRP